MMAASTQHRDKLSQYLNSHRSKPKSQPQDGQTTSKGKSTPSSSRSGHPSSTSRQKQVKLPHIPPPRFKKKTTIEDLPDEVLSYIFWRLPVGDLISASQTCKWFHQVENDNLLWQRLYARFAGKLSDEKENEIPTYELQPGCWKNLCLKRCKLKRDAIYLKKWKKPDSYTGLTQRPETTLGKVGVRFELSVKDRLDVWHTLQHSDVFWSTMSVTVRWYSLVFPDISSVRAIRVQALSPLMFYGPTRPAKDGIYQKSLLLTRTWNLKSQIRGLKPVGSDTHISLYELDPGIVMATYKVDGEIAFIAVTLHNYNLVSRCLCGHTERMWEPPEVKLIEDDIDPNYGLHDYTCVLLLRNMRQKLLEFKSTYMHCSKDKLVDGFAPYTLVRKDDKNSHEVALKQFSFPWKTGLFKGIIKDVCILDLIVLDERGQPFWTVSSCVQLGQSVHTDQFEFNPDTHRSIQYSDDVGKLLLEIGKLEDGQEYLNYFNICLSLEAINKAFKTEYK